MPTLLPGQVIEVQGSARDPYKVKCHEDRMISCTCPGWRNSPGAVSQKVCKHTRPYLTGAPVSTPTPAVQTATSKTAGGTSRGNCLLAHDWDGEMDPTGWWLSEKLDGVRALFDGKNFWSRQNAVTKKSNMFNAPDWFKVGLSHPTDGELYMGHRLFQKTCSAVKNGDSSWKQVHYMVFDAPEMGGKFEDRMEALRVFAKTWPSHVQLVEQEICTGKDHLFERLHAVEALGGEGMMLRKPGSLYEIGRSHTILKVKNFFDTEFLVVGHTVGKGKYQGMVGALECTTIAATLTVGGKTVVVPQGVHVKVGSGLTDAQRRNPPSIGSVVKGRFLELTDDSVPRNPSFAGERE